MVSITRNSSGSSERRDERLAQSVKHRSKNLMKCTVKIEKLRPNHIIKKCKIVLEKIDLSTLHQKG